MRSILLAAALVPGALAYGQTATDDAYLADIAPPPGTQYPCALTALPRALPPSGLGPFQDDVAAALVLQQTFFSRSVAVRENGGSMADVYQIPEGAWPRPA